MWVLPGTWKSRLYLSVPKSTCVHVSSHVCWLLLCGWWWGTHPSCMTGATSLIPPMTCLRGCSLHWHSDRLGTNCKLTTTPSLECIVFPYVSAKRLLTCRYVGCQYLLLEANCGGNNDTGLWDNAGDQNMLATEQKHPVGSWTDQALLVSAPSGWPNDSGLLTFLAKAAHTFLIMTFLLDLGSRLQFSCEEHHLTGVDFNRFSSQSHLAVTVCGV